MSDKDGVQWKCYVKSWVKKLNYPESVKEQLSNFFEKYCPPTLNWISALAWRLHRSGAENQLSLDLDHAEQIMNHKSCSMSF